MISGQPATIEIGQDPATVPAGSRSRVRFQCTPRVIDGGRLRLDVDLRIQVATGEKVRPNDSGIAPDRSLELKTQIELRSGETMILAGQRQASGSDSKSVLMLLTARSVGVPVQIAPP
jgi:type II secretory pathway component HofQ